VGLEPLVKRVIGLEAQQLLKNRQAEDLAVVHLRRRAGTRNQLSIPRDEVGFRQGVVQSGVNRDDQFLQVECFADCRHGSLPPQGPHATDIGPFLDGTSDASITYVPSNRSKALYYMKAGISGPAFYVRYVSAV